MSGRQNRLPIVEETKGAESDTLKKIGRFAVSPPLNPDLFMRRSSRVRRSSQDSGSAMGKILLEV